MLRLYFQGIQEIIILIYFLVMSFRFLTNVSFYIMTFVWVILGLFLSIYLYTNNPQLHNKIHLLLIVDVISYIALMYNHNEQYTLLAISCTIIAQMLGMALYILKDNLYNTSRIAFIILIAMGIYQTYLFIHSHGIVQDSKISKLVGTNTASICAIFYMFVISINIRDKNKKNYVILLCFFLLALFSSGLGNIIASGILLIGQYLLEFNNKVNWKRTLLFVVILIIFTIKFNLSFSMITAEDNSRLFLWNRYINVAIANVWNFIMGGNITNDIRFTQLRHLHNTFFNMHMKYGIIPLIFYIYIIAHSIIDTIKKQQYIYTLFLLVSVIRGFTDEGSDWFIPIWIFFYFHKNSDFENRHLLLKTKTEVIHY